MKHEILARTRNGGAIVGQTQQGLVDWCHGDPFYYVPPERVQFIPWLERASCSDA